jgi:hypothetical protein
VDAGTLTRRYLTKRKRLLSRRKSEARSRTRTDDPFLTMEVLYQLSYPGRLCALTVARDGAAFRSAGA